MVKILDCTLRDGGHYTDWHFSHNLVMDYLNAMQALPVDTIELGYRLLNVSHECGPYAYTTEEHIQSLGIMNKSKFAVMIDAIGIETNTSLYTLLKRRDESVIDMIRMAVDARKALNYGYFLEQIQDLGYKISLNLMKIHSLSLEELTYFLDQLRNHKFDVLYIADSYGSMNTQSIYEIFSLVKEKIDKPIGFHAHDNRGFSLINSLLAIQYGAEYIDTTVYGMGRGAGNLKLESFLLETSFEESLNFNCKDLLYLIENHFKPLHLKYGWGQNFFYHICGLYQKSPFAVHEAIKDKKPKDLIEDFFKQ